MEQNKDDTQRESIASWIDELRQQKGKITLGDVLKQKQDEFEIVDIQHYSNTIEDTDFEVIESKLL